MKVLGKRVLYKALKTEVLGIEQVDKYEVTHIGDEVTKIKIGDEIQPPVTAPRLNLKGEEYYVIDEEEVIAIL
jgi:co-chaperonin GroES (HSP10)